MAELPLNDPNIFESLIFQTNKQYMTAGVHLQCFLVMHRLLLLRSCISVTWVRMSSYHYQ